MSKKQKILETALTLFVENGISETSTAEIAKEAGVATGTLFHHFKNKHRLVEALYLSLKQDLVAALASEVALENINQGQLFWLDAIKWGLYKPHAFRFFEIYYASPWLSHQYRDSVLLSVFSFLHDFVIEQQRAGLFVNLPSEYILIRIQQAVLDTTRYIINNPEYNNNEFILNSYSAAISGFLAQH